MVELATESNEGFFSRKRMSEGPANCWSRRFPSLTVQQSDSRVATLFLAEYERFQTGQEFKLIGKAKNLIEAFHAITPNPPVILLMGWTLSGTDVTQARKSVKAVARDGFRNADNSWVPGVADPNRFLVYFAIFGKMGDELKLIDIQP